jgi:hypothetical protein
VPDYFICGQSCSCQGNQPAPLLLAGKSLELEYLTEGRLSVVWIIASVPASQIMKPTVVADEMFPEGAGPYMDLEEVPCRIFKTCEVKTARFTWCVP